MRKKSLATLLVLSVTAAVGCGDDDVDWVPRVAMASPSINEGVIVMTSGESAIVTTVVTSGDVTLRNPDSDAFTWEFEDKAPIALNSFGDYVFLHAVPGMTEDFATELHVRFGTHGTRSSASVPVLVLAK